MTNGEVNGWKFGWGAISSLAAIVIIAVSGISYFAGSTAAAAVLENRVTNLERRQGVLVMALEQTNRRLADLIDVLWKERIDRRRAEGKED